MQPVMIILIYGITSILFILSLVKSKEKTLRSVKKAGKMLVGMAPQLIIILFLAGLVFCAVSPDTIRNGGGAETGFGGTAAAAMLGSISLFPVFIAFPLMTELLKSGAGIVQMAAFISTLTMVGAITLPMEMRILGKKTAILRNCLLLIISVVTAYMIGAIL